MIVFFLELAFAVIVIFLGFWLGIKAMHWGWRVAMWPSQVMPSGMSYEKRVREYGNYFGTWEKRDI